MTELLDRLTTALADRYRVARELGHGGMATVYLAEDLKHHRQVAVKVLRAELAAALGPERFLREIEIAAQLHHPHILPLYDSGEAAGFLYYVMPYVEGESLRDRLTREKQLPLDDALQIAREVADALSYAHSHDVVHRDIKPENILLESGHAVVADFGIARAITAAGGAKLTETGIALGTPAYMSPEQAAGSKELDGRSDLYSLGCVLYEMLGGQPPFTGPTVESIVHQHLAAEPPAITRIRPAVPAHIAGVLARALAKTPADRFSPAAQFADALRPVAVATPSAATSGAPTLAADPVRSTAAFSAVAALVLAVVYLLVLQLGLPMWVFVAAVGLLIAELPIIVASGIAERNRVRAGAPAGWLSWRKALLAGGAAFGALALLTGGYMAARALGIGPAGSLLASGAISQRERIILADFENRTADSSQGATVTELMRVGLSRSRAVSIVDPLQVGRILRLMKRDPAAGLPFQVALEAATREGMKAVIAGDVASVGGGLSLTARLVSADGTVLLAETESARSADELVAAVDRLSGRLRERFGESLRSIRGNQPLDRVTTGSMQALRVFSQGLQASNEGDDGRAMQLLEEAIKVDSTFAMAYRKLAIILDNNAEQRSRAVWAAKQAYAFRDRLTERERYLVIAAYHRVVTGNKDQQISAYRTVLDLYPDDAYALNNLGTLYSQLRDSKRAAEYYVRALGVDSTSRLYYENLASALAQQRLFDSAMGVARRFEQRFPSNPEVKIAYAVTAAQQGDYDKAEGMVRALIAEQRGTVFWEAIAYEWWGHLDALRGRLTSARRQWTQAFRITAERGLAGQYLLRAARRSMVERLILADAARGRRLLDEAVRRFPLDKLAPLDRPYGHLAMAYAAAGDTVRARALIAEFDRTTQADHSEDAELWAHGARGVIALAERRTDAAIAELRQLDQVECATCAAPWLAQAYEQAGRQDSARALYERFVETPSADLWYDGAHLAHAYERLGEIYEARGDVPQAVQYYRRLTTLWDKPDPELMPVADNARAAIKRLTGEPRPEKNQ